VPRALLLVRWGPFTPLGARHFVRASTLAPFVRSSSCYFSIRSRPPM